MGIQFLLVFGAFLALGYWLDRKWGTSPFLLMAGTFVGGAAAFYALYREVYGRSREKKK